MGLDDLSGPLGLFLIIDDASQLSVLHAIGYGRLHAVRQGWFLYHTGWLHELSYSKFSVAYSLDVK